MNILNLVIRENLKFKPSSTVDDKDEYDTYICKVGRPKADRNAAFGHTQVFKYKVFKYEVLLTNKGKYFLLFEKFISAQHHSIP